jgi:exopolysaccharide biosynthesis polyprenyl glycosylphosphotransferase
MIKEQEYIFTRINMALDGLVGVVAIALAHGLRNDIIAPYLLPDVFRSASQFSDYAWLAWATPVILIPVLYYNRYYGSDRFRNPRELRRIAVISAIETVAILSLISFFLQGKHGENVAQRALLGNENVSRGILLLTAPILAMLLVIKSVLVSKVLVFFRARGHFCRNLLIVGSGLPLRRFLALIKNHPVWGFRVEGIIDDVGREAKFVDGIPVVGRLSNLIPFVESHCVDEVVFLPEQLSLSELTPYLEQCEVMGVRTRLSLNFFEPSIAKPVLDFFEGFPVVTYTPTREMNAALLFKYTFDRIAAAILLIVLSPIFVITAILIKITSESWKDPIFYGQTRCGLNGKPFTCWKFRSMKVGAEKELDRLRDKNVMGGPVFKMRDDPRVTKIGKFIRKTSIDELPQLWNVLRGEMSLVGPRPPIPSEVEKYDRWQRRRLSMKPGITCLWQVSGRNQLPFDVWMKLDLEYIDNWSLWLDFKILLKTVYVVATGYGAM